MTSADQISEHYQAFSELQQSDNPYVSWRVVPAESLANLTVATNQMTAREVFAQTARFLSAQSLDIEKAFLNDLSFGDSEHASIASFTVSSASGSLDPSTINVDELLAAFANHESTT